MAKRVLGSLGTMLANSQERGLVATNVMRSMKRDRKRGKDWQAERRTKEIKAIIAKLSDPWRPVFVTAFTGLRASELRELKWKDVDLKQDKLHGKQRTDRYLKIGEPKSEAGNARSPSLPRS